MHPTMGCFCGRDDSSEALGALRSCLRDTYYTAKQDLEYARTATEAIIAYTRMQVAKETLAANGQPVE